MSAVSKKERLARWLDDRTGLVSAVACRAASTVPGRAWLGRLWPSMILLVFIVQVITGLVLWTYYSPGTDSAWESVYYLQYEVAGGWLVRGVHHYAAQVLVALLGLYLVQLVMAGRYRRPREFVFWVALMMTLVSLGLCLTGDLLPWDQNRVTATQTRVSFLMLLPGVGGHLYKVAAGGPSFGQLTLTRFFALHVGVFAVTFAGLLALHGWVAHRAARAMGSDVPQSGPYWPRQFACNAMAGALVMLVILGLVFQGAFQGEHTDRPAGDYLGAELGPPADPDPASASAAARPEWSFRALYELTHAFPGKWQFVPVFVIPTVMLLYAFAMPLVGIGRLGHWLNVLVTLALLSGAGWLTWKSYHTDARDPDYQAAVADQRAKAQRVIELARGQGIPRGGALALMRSDPKLEGPRLFAQHCAACHTYSPPSGQTIGPDEPSAPELYGFAGAEWMASLLDPDEIQSERYFGNTRFAAGVMVKYVEGHAEDWDARTRQALIAALVAEAQLPIPSPEQGDREALVAGGRELIVSQGCTRCHRFGEHGVGGDAPELTDYGSPQWLAGIIADPAHSAFYATRNDRMPAYVESLEQVTENRLSFDQIDLLVRWLRGAWYEPGREQPREGVGRAGLPVLAALGRWKALRLPQPPTPTDPTGRALAAFRRAQCHLCHDYVDESGQGVKSYQPSAPNLYRFASAEWIRGLLDPDQVAGPKYFGTNEHFRDGSMAEFVQEDLEEYVSDVGEFLMEDLVFEAIDAGREVQFALEHLTQLKAEIGEEKLRKQAAEAAADDRFDEFVEEHADDQWIEELGRQKLEELIATLADEAQRAEPTEGDEETEALFEEFGCAECHKFYGVGELGDGPDLTGYGSPQWLAAIIADPEQERFYPDSNQGMPAYQAFADEPHRNLLSDEEIQLIADLIRGQLDEPPRPTQR